MGPRSFNRGNAERAPMQANDELQWGRGLSTAEIPAGSALPVTLDFRFNGAAVFQPRKYDQRLLVGTLCPGFNGAAVFQPRKFVEHVFTSQTMAMLQWGRGL